MIVTTCADELSSACDVRMLTREFDTPTIVLGLTVTVFILRLSAYAETGGPRLRVQQRYSTSGLAFVEHGDVQVSDLCLVNLLPT